MQTSPFGVPSPLDFSACSRYNEEKPKVAIPMTINEYQTLAMKTLNPELSKRMSLSTVSWAYAANPAKPSTS